MMRGDRSVAAWRRALLAAECGLLGRARVGVHRALDACEALCGAEPWCDRCGASLVGAGATSVQGGARFAELPACEACGGRGAFDHFARLGVYKPPFDRLVRGVKRGALHDMACEIGRRLGQRLRTRGVDRGWVVVPIPANFWRRLSRGIDHADEMARGVAREIDCTLVRGLRMRAAARQAGLDRARRLGRGARMALRRGASDRLGGRSVVLVDDIRTTGATLREARELLLEAGAIRISAAVACVCDRSQAQFLNGFV
jgi:predicted amidophosphoribosyltransferase